MLLSKNKEYSDMCYRIESKPVRERPKKKDKEEEEEKKRRKTYMHKSNIDPCKEKN